ncbi:hypothetical protein [Nostoc sp. ChiVER01]|uniref:hypothetical protein n=1 Tax=Nostoc sp. ChiVER01 TaxID=3075382 RepID=UPI002AD3A171|nr:hypothetical protein [Nostoc sp. ChiVER01]MDZ8224306.1 hypothetical protein [Nostoc sp. ChiVER01]
MDNCKLTESYKIAIGCITAMIILPFVWHNYQQYKEEQEFKARTIKNCETLKAVRNEAIRRMKAGEPVSIKEASRAYQIKISIPDDCRNLLN